MRGFRSNLKRLTLLGRLSAWSCVTLVALLAWLSADPSAHAWLHAHDDHAHHCNHCEGSHHHDEPSLPDDDGCIVAQFAQGHVDLAVAPSLLLGVAHWERAFTPLSFSPLVTREDHRLPPGCGPPAI